MFRHLEVERRGDVFWARLRRNQLGEFDVLELADELQTLVVDQGCRQLALRLGPEALECLYSVFLAKLVMIRRRLLECGGLLVLWDAPPDVLGVFEACHLKDHFQFAPDEAAARALLERRS
jgi:hypothetical protein